MPEIKLYNLLISNNETNFDGKPWLLDASRCVNEYTDDSLKAKYGALDTGAISALLRLPCIFGYEAYHKKQPKFGLLRDVVQRQGQVRIEYEIHELDHFLSAEDLKKLSFELDISAWELNRTHWAVKDVDLAKELKMCGIVLPTWAYGTGQTVDITTHSFRVALSFPGECRVFVEEIVARLESKLGPHSYFYDKNYEAQLARPSLDLLLQGIYRDRADLVVVFIGADYERKDWCGVEWRAIREIISQRDADRVMFVRMDDGDVEGVMSTDGYVDARKSSADEITGHIEERVALLG